MESRTKQGFPGALPFFGNNREQEDARERHGRDERREYAEHENEGKPCTMLVPSQKRMTPEIIMVRCPSRMAGHARLKPICTASRGVLPERNSSLVRSNISNVRVHRHANRDDEPRDTGGGERDGITFYDGEHECEIFRRARAH